MQLREQTLFCQPVVLKRSMVVEMIVTQVGECTGGNVDTVEPVLVETVA